MKISHVLIDWYGTLSVSKFWGHWLAAGHPRNGQFARIEALWAGELAPILSPWMRGAHASEDFVRAVSGHLGVDHSWLMDEFILSCQQMRMIAPEALDKVQDLRRCGVRVWIATDNMDSFTRWTAPALALDRYFDGILNSHAIASLKHEATASGNSAFFGRFLDEHGIRRGECVLIDDSDLLPVPLGKWGIECRKVAFGEGPSRELDAILASI